MFLLFLEGAGDQMAHKELRRPKAKKRIKPIKSKSLGEIQMSSRAGVWTHRKQQYSDFRINICQNRTGVSCLHRRNPSSVV